MGRYTGKTCRLSVMLTFTFTFFLVEIVFGYITNSMALVADSFHMLSDVVALVVAFFCMKISKKRSSSKNTFGWVRAEVLGALINAVFLIALCFSIFIEALKRLIDPEDIHDPLKILIVGVLGFMVNIVGIFMFHGHASVHGHSHARPVPLNLPLNGANGVSVHVSDGTRLPTRGSKGGLDGEETLMITSEENGKGGRLENDDYDEDAATAEELSPVITEAHNISFFNTAGNDTEQLKRRSTSVENASKSGKGIRKDSTGGGASGQLNMHGVFLHILGDAFGSIIVIINAIVCWQVDNEKLKKYLDPSLSLAMATIILSTTLPLFKESALILLQTVPTHINVEEIKRKLLRSVDGVLAVHEFHVWRLAGNKIIATAHIRCRTLDDYMRIAGRVKQLFHDEGIHSTTIQPEFDEVSEPNFEQCVLECPKAGECAPSMCCSASGTRLLELTSDGTVAVKDLRPTSTAQISAKDQVVQQAPSAPRNLDTIADGNSASMHSSDDDSHKGVPPMFYYKRGYEHMGDQRPSRPSVDL